VESDSLVSDLSATVSRLAQGKTISLGLSGGVDSRILLNVLLKSNVKFTAHTFGFGYEDDVKLAEQLSCALGIKNRRYHALPENKSAFIRDFLSHSPFAVSLHRTLLLNAFSLFSENQCVIDGTSGEFFRGHYFRRWKLARRFGLGDSMVFEAVSTPLPEFFNRDFASMCKDEAKINFIEFIREFRDQRVFEKDYDMAYVKYYNPNYRAREQSRMDESVVSFLPFHQSNLIYSFIRKGKNYFDFKEFSKEGIFREFPFATNSVVRPFEGCGNVFSLYEDEKIRDSILNLMHHSFFKTILSKNGVDSVYRFYEKSNMNDLARMDKISSFLLSSGLLYL
ncbi:MAG: asparagine synthase-related protein, partial [bacterium]|nr:asparagine synthase-related protein [bacterium]